MIGVDIVCISRIRNAICNAAFVNRVFTPAEQAYCNGKHDRAQSFAGLFCAKEAAVKALGVGFGRGIMPTDIEVVHDDGGAPKLKFHGGATELFCGYAACVSISHDGDNAVAAVELTPKRKRRKQ